jgi:hypothetical protein
MYQEKIILFSHWKWNVEVEDSFSLMWSGFIVLLGESRTTTCIWLWGARWKWRVSLVNTDQAINVKPARLHEKVCKKILSIWVWFSWQQLCRIENCVNKSFLTVLMKPMKDRIKYLDFLHLGHEKNDFGYHFRAHPKLDPHFFSFCWKNAEFQTKIICKPSNIDVKAVVEAFTDNNNEDQLLDFKAVVEPTDELYCNDTNNETRVLRNFIICQSCWRQWVIMFQRKSV